LIHAPSVYDFRERAIMYGPLSDLIPSSPVFEMYPLGFATISSYLEERGYRVRIINLALRMMENRRFDVPAFLARLKPRLFGIDLHWLPHAHGSLEVAKILKELHPEIPVVVGGLSASYFHRELIAYPQVDYVVRGDMTEEPLYRLLKRVEGRGPLDDVPNLVWKDGGGIRVNEMGFMPASLDYADLRPDLLIKQVLRYRDRASLMPYGGWWGNPVAALLTVKGCTHSCATCGGSKEAFLETTGRRHPAYRSPESVMKNILDIAGFSRGPIFLIGDIRQPGEGYAQGLLRLLRRNPVPNELVFELFEMADREFIEEIGNSVQNWTLELSPESHDPEIRRVHDPTVSYGNGEVENTIKYALETSCHRVDIFFMIGLSRQSYRSVMGTVDYVERLFQRFDRRISAFISPLGPFLDPGSRGFEDPEKLGYRLFARTLEEHRKLLLQPTWRYMLNYETEWMSREELVRATYDAGERLNRLKLEYGRIDRRRGEAVAARIERARELQRRLDGYDLQKISPPAELVGEVHKFSVSTVCDKRELAWPAHLVN
ncbi:MAG: TIGR04190 family B12-binding domain/radical SAM domain protein, partial [Candidatus Bipolaricaulia bacterium]